MYIDSNANGVRNAGVDAPIQGATVRLLDANTLAVLATTTTAADGSYSFTNLDPLVWYAVEEVQPTTPAGLVQGPVNLGLVNGVSCAAQMLVLSRPAALCAHPGPPATCPWLCLPGPALILSRPPAPSKISDARNGPAGPFLRLNQNKERSFF